MIRARPFKFNQAAHTFGIRTADVSEVYGTRELMMRHITFCPQVQFRRKRRSGRRVQALSVQGACGYSWREEATTVRCLLLFRDSKDHAGG